MPKVAHLVAVTQHCLQANRVGIVLAVLEAIAVGDAVAHASNLDRLCCVCATGAKTQGYNKEYAFILHFHSLHFSLKTRCNAGRTLSRPVPS